ncbi:hypothetical protein L873DRAFT_1804486 [Choiromyces venosus 120613-1]|uniref:Uncharacterized protein n=1 Tax=Choiromyces venosus 120613-1 TaxID=1336337 RepID=A0A3N4JR21_9PEZI|nr:hypothetical protein L873DRAFT_1804486 [Choiromyces venosus 120613-1]
MKPQLEKEMATRYRSHIPLPIPNEIRNRYQAPRYYRHHHTYHHPIYGYLMLPPKAWENYLQDQQNARQDRLWYQEERENMRAFFARREALVFGRSFFWEDQGGLAGAALDPYYPGCNGSNDDNFDESTFGRRAGFTNSARLKGSPLSERLEKPKVSSHLPPPTRPTSGTEDLAGERAGEEPKETIEAMLERCRGPRNYRKKRAEMEILRERRKEVISQEITPFERLLVEYTFDSRGFPVHRDRQ